MALNIAFDGFCYLEDNSLSNLNVKYQAYFHHVNAGSSPSTWNDVRTVENTGYWNVNLGDGDWLGQTGNASAGDRVVIVFWTPTTDGRMDLTLEQWGSFQIILTAADTYSNNTQIKSNICPDLSWNMQASADVYDVVSISNNSDDVHSWTYGSVTMWHRDNYNTTIQAINDVNNTDYDYDDGNQDINLAGAAGTTHFWTSAGDYDVEIVIEDESGCTVTGTKPIRIYWREPTCGIKCNGDLNTPDSVVTFEFDGGDLDNKIYNIDWQINDTGIYGNTTTVTSGIKTDVISHSAGIGTDWHGHVATPGAFTNPGSHLVEAWVRWNDGFSNQTLYCSETFVQQRFDGPTVDFHQDPTKALLDSSVKFINDSTNTGRVGLGLPNHYEYEWRWNDNGNISYEYDKPYTYELEKTPNTVNCDVRLCADWSDGWDTQTTCKQKDVIFDTIVTVSGIDCYYSMYVVGTANDGTIGGYSWDIYQYTTYSGVGPPSGPTELIWESPQGIDQQRKEICFTEIGWYKLEGWVHSALNSPAQDDSDYEDLLITEVCTTISGSFVDIWDGTGINDYGGDWIRSGYGFESTASMHTGTNGLEAIGMTKNDTIRFARGGQVDVSGYEALMIWVNVRDWSNTADMNVYFNNGTTVNLDDYIDITMIGEWQRALIPLSTLNLSSFPSFVKRLTLKTTGDVSVWLDDIKLMVGIVFAAICSPNLVSHEFGMKGQVGRELKPSMRSLPETREHVVGVKKYPFYIRNL